MTAGQAGQQLRRVRERLGLRYRDVEQASMQLAAEHGNYEFGIGLSRLADIESKGTTPSIYRLYALCAIYKLNYNHVLKWYGINLQTLASDSLKNSLEKTALLEFGPAGPEASGSGMIVQPIRPEHTVLLSNEMVRVGVHLGLLSDEGLLRERANRLALVGSGDHSMSPLIPPSSVIEVDEQRQRVRQPVGETRPIYFLETRAGYKIGWCSVRSGYLYLQVQPHSGEGPFVYKKGASAEVLGEIVAVIQRKDLGSELHGDSAEDQGLLQSQ